MKLPPSCPSRELFEHALESTCRAIAGERGLAISLSTSEKPATRQIAATRGIYDAIGVRVRYHDADLHHSMAPDGPLSRVIYDEFENLRIEAVAP